MELLGNLSNLIWSNFFVYLCLGVGVFFSIRTRLVQLRQVPEMLRLMVKGESPRRASPRSRR